MAHPADLAGTAAAAVHDLALLSRPAITTLDIDDLEHVTAALADLAAALPQTLGQLRRYLPHGATADRAAASLNQARAAAQHLAGLLDEARQALGDTAGPTKQNPGGVKIQPTERGQFSTGVDSRGQSRRMPRRCGERGLPLPASRRKLVPAPSLPAPHLSDWALHVDTHASHRAAPRRAGRARRIWRVGGVINT